MELKKSGGFGILPSGKTLSLDDILSMIIDDHHITKANFVVYEFTPRKRYEKIDPEESMKEHIEVQACDLASELPRLRAYAGESDYLLGITSQVMVKQRGKETPQHLFFMDFDSSFCPASQENLEVVKEFVESSHLSPGFVLESGRSYHFYSHGIFNEAQWTEMLEDALYPVDEDWKDLQLRRGYAVLRVSTNTQKRILPLPVEAVGYQLVNPAQLYLFDEYKPKWPLERILPRSYLL